MFKFEDKYEEYSKKVYQLDALNQNLMIEDFKASLEDLKQNFKPQDDSEILVRFQNRNDTTNNFLDSIFGKSQTNSSSLGELISRNSEDLCSEDIKIKFFNKEHIIEMQEENYDSENNTKSLSLMGDSWEVIQFCNRLNKLILQECDESAFAITIESDHKIICLTSFKDDDDLVLYKDVPRDETNTRIEAFLWSTYRKEINRGFTTHDQAPDLESFIKMENELHGYDFYTTLLKFYDTAEYLSIFHNLLKERWQCSNLF